jgi:hypothetical protein
MVGDGGGQRFIELETSGMIGVAHREKKADHLVTATAAATGTGRIGLARWNYAYPR